MKILFLSKKTDWCEKAKQYVLQNFDEVKVYQGDGENKLPIEAVNWEGDMIISFLSPWVIPEKTLKNAKRAINFHPGTPAYGGIGCYNFAIYNEEKKYGVLCHKMEKKVDSGEIIKIRYFEMSKDETVVSLKEKSMENILKLFYEIVDLVSKGKDLPIAGEQWKKRPYTKKEFQELCKITLDMPGKEILKRIRATYYPSGPDYPYIKFDGKKITLKEIEINGMEDTTI